jgi:pimeloyl-ACP methyl ester carboxylesterase
MAFPVRLGLLLAAFAVGGTACQAPAYSDGANEPSSKKKKKSTDDSKDSAAQAQTAAPRPPLPTATFTFAPCTGAYKEARSCGTALVPLDYANPNGPKITLFVARIGSADPNATQLYMLPGGPGGPASGMIWIAQEAIKQRPDLDVILVEHRGVGRATRLACPRQTAAKAADPLTDQNACVAEVKGTQGDVMAQFTTSNAARDVAVAVQSLKGQNHAFVYGVSYGTYWVHRFMQVTPIDVDGVIVDSCFDQSDTYDNFPTQYDGVTRRLAQLCASDRTCASMLGGDPFASMASIISGAASSRCGQSLGLDREGIVNTLTSMLTTRTLQELVPSFLARFNRCDADDSTALNNFFQQLNAPGDPEPEDLNGDVLYKNVVYSELWATPAPTEEALTQRYSQFVVSPMGSVQDVPLQAAWPHYTMDEYARKWAQTKMPVLVMNGDMDVQTPIESARSYETNLTGANKYFVFVPWSNHGTIIQSPMADGHNCGMQVMFEFMQNPGTRPAATCTTQTMPPNVNSTPDTVGGFYRTSTAWTRGTGDPVQSDDSKAAIERTHKILQTLGPRRFAQHAAAVRPNIFGPQNRIDPVILPTPMLRLSR